MSMQELVYRSHGPAPGTIQSRGEMEKADRIEITLSRIEKKENRGARGRDRNPCTGEEEPIPRHRQRRNSANVR